MGKGGLALGFGLIVLLGAISIPAAIDSTDSTEVESSQIDIGETHLFDNQIEVSVIDSTQTDATIRVTDIETGETRDLTIEEGSTENITFSPGTFSVTNEVSNNQAVTLTIEYPSIYGFSPAARIIGDNLAVILVSMFFVAIMAFVGVRK